MVVQPSLVGLLGLLTVLSIAACSKGSPRPPTSGTAEPSATTTDPTSAGTGVAPQPSAAPQLTAAADPNAVAPTEIAELRKALHGAPLTDAEVLFVHRSLLASKTEYTQRGLWTFREWSLGAEVTRSGDALKLFVAGEKVNAEWELTLFPDGKIKQGAVFTR